MNIEVSYVKPIGFNNHSHIANFVRYLFNITAKYENEATKDNLYFSKQENGIAFIDVKRFYEDEMKDLFDDRKFRDKESKGLSADLLSVARTNFNKIITDIFYFRVDNNETIKANDFVKILLENGISVENFMMSFIENNENEDLRNIIASQYIVGHFNQGANHFHRVIVLR